MVAAVREGRRFIGIEKNAGTYHHKLKPVDFVEIARARIKKEPIPNFPPGGTFAPRAPKRFGMKDRGVPLYLRTMSATGDREWIAEAMKRANGGQEPDPAAVDAAYKSWLSRAESDLLLVLECDNRFLMIDLWDAVRSRVIEAEGLEVVSLQEGLNRGDGRDHTGYRRRERVFLL